MNVAFIFDTKLIEIDNNFFGMTLTYDFFVERYLNFFDEIVVSTRVEQNKNVDEPGYCRTNGKNVKVKPIRSYNNILDIILKNKIIKKELESVIKNVDKVIIRMPSVLGIVACELCEKNKKDYIIEMVACAWDGYMNHSNILGKIIAPIMYYLTKRKILNAPKVIYVTNNFLQKRYPTKGKSYTCSDVKLLNNHNELDKRINKITETDIKKIKMLTVANVGMKYKGHQYVLKAISKLKKKTGIAPIYYLVGNGSQKRLKKIIDKYDIEDNVVFCGSLKHNEVFEKMKECDLYIQPSLQEGLPRAVIEAMSVAMPIYGTKCGGIPELISEKAVFKKKNVSQIVKIIENISLNELLELSKENYNNSKKYSIESIDMKRKKIMEDFTKDEA